MFSYCSTVSDQLWSLAFDISTIQILKMSPLRDIVSDMDWFNNRGSFSLLREQHRNTFGSEKHKSNNLITTQMSGSQLDNCRCNQADFNYRKAFYLDFPNNIVLTVAIPHSPPQSRILW